jgi:hypothetical protein
MYVSYSGLLTYSARGARAIAVCALFVWSAVWLLSRSANPSPPVVAAALHATLESHVPNTVDRTTGDANHAPLGRRARLTTRAKDGTTLSALPDRPGRVRTDWFLPHVTQSVIMTAVSDRGCTSRISSPGALDHLHQRLTLASRAGRLSVPPPPLAQRPMEAV